MKNKKIVITGWTHSGKTRLAEFLSERLGMKLLKTCTTRPKRTPDEDTCHFYTETEAAKIPEAEKIFRTFAVDGYERWTGKEDFLKADIAVLDMTGVPQAVRFWQEYGNTVCIIYVFAETAARYNVWIQNALDTGKDENAAIHTLEERELSETSMFDQFEARILDVFNESFLYPDSDLSENLFGEDGLIIWKNIYISEDMNRFISWLCANSINFICSRHWGFHNKDPQILELYH